MDITPLNALVENDPVRLNALQIILAPYAGGITLSWVVLWILVAVVLCGKVFLVIRKNRDRR